MPESIADTLSRIETKRGGKLIAKEQTFVTPYLPPLGNMAVKNHRIASKQPAFVRALLHNPNYAGYCPNCGGGGFVYVTLLDAGPFREVPACKKPITWFDGDGHNGKGWYIVDRTLSFQCPECVK